MVHSPIVLERIPQADRSRRCLFPNLVTPPQSDRRGAGLASGLVSSMFQMSGALAVAIIGGLFFGLAGVADNPRSIAYAYAVSAIAIALCLFISAWYSSNLPDKKTVINGGTTVAFVVVLAFSSRAFG
jgi:hypothetical protein